jgi:polyhydroxyalkanoate synthase
MGETLRYQAEGGVTDPLNLAGALVATAMRTMADPGAAMQSRLKLWERHLALWQHTAAGAAGEQTKPVVEPAASDRRFRDPSWDTHPAFSFIKQSYLLAAQWMQEELRNLQGLDEHTTQKLGFYTRQFIDAMAPTNFVMTNPEVLRATLESNGENLVRGIEHLREDLRRGNGQLNVKMTDLDAFQVGKNVAVTPGKVVYQNDVMQLIQYEPTTESVYRRPLLIVPPWINKYYILDLRPDNSFIRWCVDHEYTVFVVSWVNPDERLAGKTFEDYALEGPLAALDAIERATGEDEVSTVGYCVGGTLMATTLAYMAAREDTRVTSCTLLAAQVDFTEAGELSVFVDEDQLRYLEQRMARHGGVLDGPAMAATFNMLRSNELIWSFVVNNYLLGREPLPFDLLYWNSDSTRIPAPVHSYYLRNMYQRNRLVLPRELEVGGVPIELHRIKTPVYMQASKEDHIAPARSVFKATRHFAGPIRFMLAGSGHIAGVINPPAAKKYQYWTKKKAKKYPTFEDWFQTADEHPGSWWPDWHAWLSKRSGDKVPARVPGDGALAPIEDAPGSYVLVRSDGDAGPSAAA